MAGTGPGDLYALCQELLDASVAALNTIPSFEPALASAPARSFVSPGQPALDCCPQLTVHVTQSQHLAPQTATLPGAKQQNRVNGPTLMVTIVRCIPGPDDSANPPAIADMEEAAEQIHADGWALWNHLFNLWTAGALLTICGVLSMDLQPLPPQGGCAGWRLTVRTNLDGYQEAIGT